MDISRTFKNFLIFECKLVLVQIILNIPILLPFHYKYTRTYFLKKTVVGWFLNDLWSFGTYLRMIKYNLNIVFNLMMISFHKNIIIGNNNRLESINFIDKILKMSHQRVGVFTALDGVRVLHIRLLWAFIQFWKIKTNMLAKCIYYTYNIHVSHRDFPLLISSLTFIFSMESNTRKHISLQICIFNN